MSSFSVFIPRVFSNFTEKDISTFFSDLNIGKAENIKLVRKTNSKGDSYNMVFVHFNHLYDSEEAKKFRTSLKNPNDQTKLVYQDPWFWIVRPFKNKENPIKQPELNIRAESFVPDESSNNPQCQAYMNHYQPGYYNQDPGLFQPEYYPNYHMGYGSMMMTPQGPMWYPTQTKMIPAQVIYGKRLARQRPHPRKKLNVPKKQKGEDGKIDM